MSARNYLIIVREDLRSARVQFKSFVGIIYYFTDFGFFNLQLYRASSCLRDSFLKYLLIHILIERIQSFFFGVHIPPSVEIGGGALIFHGYGIVLNSKVVIGDRVVLYHRVTIGQRYPGDGVPIIGDDVVIGSGATILGPVEVPCGAVVPANSLTTPCQNSWRIL